MTREEAISVLEESKRQNEIMRDNPNTFFKVSDIVTGEKNAQKRIDALNMAISTLRQQEAVTKCRDLFDEDGGEILSNSSEMTLDDAIAHLDNTLSDTGRKWSCESCRQEHVQLRAWLAELREIKQNRNEPLTLYELRSAYKFGCPVWLVGMEDGDGWVFIHHVDSCSVRYARIGTSEEWCFRTKSYGVRVWAYRQKPEEGTV